ncbi:hypothetical protein [Streptomyces sp. NPDC048309]|uniref:hypothetical protein n=1 Tax=Streptomyces sp. NPDC048309 TaxID=3154618 RepID=UPI0033F7F7C4
MRYDASAAMIARPDGARTLTGHDGFSVPIEPTLFRGVTPERIAAVDAAVPAEAVVRLPARDPERIPQPPEPEPELEPERARQRRGQGGTAGRGWTAALWLLGLLAVAWAMFGTAVTVDETGSAHTDGARIFLIWFLELPLLWNIRAMRQRRARARAGT